MNHADNKDILSWTLFYMSTKSNLTESDIFQAMIGIGRNLTTLPPTPPGIRFRTTAVHKVELRLANHSWQP